MINTWYEVFESNICFLKQEIAYMMMWSVMIMVIDTGLASINDPIDRCHEKQLVWDTIEHFHCTFTHVIKCQPLLWRVCTYKDHKKQHIHKWPE